MCVLLPALHTQRNTHTLTSASHTDIRAAQTALKSTASNRALRPTHSASASARAMNSKSGRATEHRLPRGMIAIKSNEIIAHADDGISMTYSIIAVMCPCLLLQQRVAFVDDDPPQYVRRADAWNLDSFCARVRSD